MALGGRSKTMRRRRETRMEKRIRRVTDEENMREKEEDRIKRGRGSEKDKGEVHGKEEKGRQKSISMFEPISAPLE